MLWSISTWKISIDSIGPQTNNHLEGWHNWLKRVARKAHPNFYELIEIIRSSRFQCWVYWWHFSSWYFYCMALHIANCCCHKIVEFFDALLAQPTDQPWLFRATDCRRQKRAPQLIAVTSITGEFKDHLYTYWISLVHSAILRYQSLPDLVSHLSKIYHKHQILSKQNNWRERLLLYHKLWGYQTHTLT